MSTCDTAKRRGCNGQRRQLTAYLQRKIMENAKMCFVGIEVYGGWVKVIMDPWFFKAKIQSKHEGNSK